MEKAGYFLLKLITWIFWLFPLRFHYFMVNFCYFVIYHIFRYRRAVVESNLKNSFPEKTPRERTRIASHFYRHFCDVFIETLYFDRIPIDEAKASVTYSNAEFVNDYLRQGRHVVVFLGHYNNWEWFSNWPLYSPFKFYSIYKKLRNATFEHFYFLIES